MMTSNAKSATTTPFKIGWWTLIVLSVLSFVGHASLLFILPGEEVLFLGWAGLNAFSTVVLAIPYRRLEPWAWWATWALVVPYALTFAVGADIGLYYLIAAALMAIAQLMTRGGFGK